MPCVIQVRYSILADHCVCVYGVDGDTVRVGDPLEGQVTWSRATLERRWRRTAIFVQPLP